MNYDIRKLLIEQARLGKPISYGDIMRSLSLNHDNPSHRNELSTMLYEISNYEHQNGRPLLSAMAMYSGLSDHGPGFYELSEQFGFGSKKALQEKLFAFEQMKACEELWRNPENYSMLSTDAITSKKHEMGFYTVEEIEFLASWGGKVYDKENREHVAAKNYIMNSLGSKTVYWSNELVKIMHGFETFNWRMWSQKGWDDKPSGKVRVARFKPYTWARIYRVGDDHKDVFFTVGVDALRKELVFKLDYYKEANSHLTSKQREIVRINIPEEVAWRAISLDSLDGYSWEMLIAESSSFIAENTYIYDKLIALAWGGKTPEEVFSDTLRKQSKPTGGLSALPILNPTFTGTDKDFVQDAIEKKEIGDAGEELVLHYEKTWLKNHNLHEFVDAVIKVKDGMGYDIHSFNKEGKPKYIEVKTTKGKSSTPFDYTINEYLFAERHSQDYQIYRLYNYNEDNNTADFYVIERPLEELLFQPTNFKVYTKLQE